MKNVIRHIQLVPLSMSLQQTFARSSAALESLVTGCEKLRSGLNRVVIDCGSANAIGLMITITEKKIR